VQQQSIGSEEGKIMWRFFAWLIALWGGKRHVVAWPGSVFLVRWVLWHSSRSRLFLHHFFRGDVESELHSHPWDFWSLILWGGYNEVTARAPSGPDDDLYPPALDRRWYGPLSLLRRPALWYHRVDVPAGRQCWSLVWAGPKIREWDFACADGRKIPGWTFVRRTKHGLAGCAED
jgi:hypothetical protein